MKIRFKNAPQWGVGLLSILYITSSIAQTPLCDKEIHVRILNHSQQPIIQAEVFIEDLHILQNCAKPNTNWIFGLTVSTSIKASQVKKKSK